MKILMVCEDIPALQLGGLGKHVVTLSNALLAKGHEVALLGRTEPDYQSCSTEVGFRGRFIPALDMTHSGWKEPALGFFNPWKRPFFARRIAKAIRRHARGFDIVHYHGHLPMVGRYVPSAVPFVQTRHDQGSECIIHLRFRNGDVCRELDPRACASCIHQAPGPLRTAFSAHAVSRYRRETADAFAQHPVVFVSNFLQEAFAKVMPDADMTKAHVVHNFVSEAALWGASQAVDLNASASTVWRIVIAGRMDEAKGFGAFLEAALPKLDNNVSIEIIGDGPARAVVEKRHRDPRVVFRGHQLNAVVLAATAAADVSVVPSVWQEPFGTTTLEALRLGKLCFALAHGGTPELAIYGAPGQLRLFPDMNSLVDGLIEVLRAGKPSIVTGGVSTSLTHGCSADVAHAAERLLALYRDIVTERPRA